MEHIIGLVIFVGFLFIVWRLVNPTEANKFGGEAQSLWDRIKAKFGK